LREEVSLAFRGINSVNIDAKGRFAMPTRYRDALINENEGKLVVTIDVEEHCLLLYQNSEWEKIEAKLAALPSLNPVSRRMQRLLIGHASDVEMDGSGRLLLPPLLRDYAKVDKHVVLLGQSNKFEIWDEALWKSQRATWLKEDLNLDELPEEVQNIAL
jgi:MraZ protein